MKKENLPLIIAVALPILLILVVAALAIFPRYMGKPQYDFIYTEDMGSKYYSYNGNTCTIYKKYYELDSSNKIVVKEFYVSPFSDAPEEKIKEPCVGMATILKEIPDLYVYDFETESSLKISLENLDQYTIVAQKTSPDGYQVAYRYGHNGIFEIFGSSNDRSGIYLIKNNPLRTLNLETDSSDTYGTRDFRLIGWVQ